MLVEDPEGAASEADAPVVWAGAAVAAAAGTRVAAAAVTVSALTASSPKVRLPYPVNRPATMAS